MFIQTENTPNPSTLKFIPEKNILKKGNFEFKSKSEAKISPLAMKLFENEDVKNVFFGNPRLSFQTKHSCKKNKVSNCLG